MTTLDAAPPGRRPSRRLVLAVVVVAAVAATLIGVFAFRGSQPVSAPTQGIGPTGPTGPQMLRHPLGGPAKEVTLGQAAAGIGEPVVLPDTSLVGPADVGEVWADAGPYWPTYHPTEANAAVTFPAQRVIVSYVVPKIGTASGIAKGIPEASVIDLSGTPALAIPQDRVAQRFGLVDFGVSGLGIEVRGPYDEATLQAIAQSILDRYRLQTPQKLPILEPIDWAHAPAGKRVDSMAAAAASLAFPPLRARRLGTPTVFVDRGRGELTLVYDHAADKKYWPYEKSWVTERPAGSTTTADLRAIAKACAAKGGCDGSARMIALRDRREGLLITGAKITALSWVDGGVYFDVRQASTGGGIDALSVANWFILAKER